MLAAAAGLSIHAVVACSDDDKGTPTADGGVDAGDRNPVDSGTKTVADAAGGDDAGGDDAATSDAGALAVSLKFKAKVGTEDFKCGTTYPNQGTTNETVEPRDLRFFVQDVKLIDGSGAEVPIALEARAPWQTAKVALLDFEDGTAKCANGNPERNDTVTGTVPAGTYTGIAFSNGVPEELNHLDPATEEAPLNAGLMSWGWLLGHLFIKAEVASTTTDGGLGLLHLGSVGCANDAGAGGDPDYNKAPATACAQPNRNLVKLTGFDPTKNTIVFDVKTLFSQTDLAVDNQCHSGGGSCPPLFANVGLDFDGGARLATTPVFRVE